jgi:hypothetical protein
MRVARLALVLACFGWPIVATAQDAADINKIADMMVRLCVGGGHTETTSGGGAGGVDLSVRSFDVTGHLKGEFKVGKASAEGLVNGIDNALSQVAADEADKVRACLQPVRERLLDFMLPLKGQGSAGQTRGDTRICAPFSIYGLRLFNGRARPIDELSEMVVPDLFWLYGDYIMDSSYKRCQYLSVLLQDANKPGRGWYVVNQAMSTRENSILVNLALGETRNASTVNAYVASSDSEADIPLKVWFDSPPGIGAPESGVTLRRSGR